MQHLAGRNIEEEEELVNHSVFKQEILQKLTDSGRNACAWHRVLNDPFSFTALPNKTGLTTETLAGNSEIGLVR